ETLKPFGDPPVAPAAAPDPGNQRHSLNFLLPPAWTNPPGGALQVRAAATIGSDAPKTLAAWASFQTPPWPPTFRVLHVEVCALDANNQRQCASDPGDVSDSMQKMYPVPDGGIEYNPISAGLIDWPGKLEPVAFTQSLLAYYFLLEQPV